MSTEQYAPAHTYLTLNQIDDLRDACHKVSGNNALRNELIVVILADFGLRVNELIQLKPSMFNLEEGNLELPSSIQKDYPNDRSPRTARLRIDPYKKFGTERLLRTYLRSELYNSRDSDYLFPSRVSNQMTTQAVRNALKTISEEAEISPRHTEHESTEPSDVTPHTLRHSLASYMLSEDARLVDVRNRLRHRSIQTTERIYEHFTVR